ncbi:MAG: ABC transporter ATP-binding protein [Clostridia bacterium]|nr:ABC transporter ATP-binding protein [Clostridia bacterium]
MKRLFPYLRPYRAQAILAPLFKLAEAIFELLVPLLVADVIDKGIPSGDARYILGRVGLMVALAAAGLAFSLSAQYFAAKTAVGVAKSLRQNLFRHVQSLSFAELDELGAANVVNRFNSDCQEVQNGVNMTLRLLLRSPFIVFGAMIAAFTVDSSAWLFAVLIPVLTVVVVAVTLSTVPLYKLSRQRLDAVTEAVRENLTGRRVVRAFAAEHSEVARFEVLHRNLTYVERRAGRVAALLNPLTYVVVNGAVIALVYVGALRIHRGALSTGQLVAMYNYMTQILVELLKLTDLVVLLTRAIASGRRLAETFDVTSSQTFPDVMPEAVSTPYAVRFEDVRMRYAEGSMPAVDGVSLDLPYGQTLGIIGATGSGKSSLVGLIPRFYDFQEGRVLLAGVDVRAYPKEALRRAVAVVMQHSVMFTGTLRDNLTLGNPAATDEEIMHAVELAQAADVVAAKGGLDAEVAEGGRNLSGGQRQRIAIARALLTHPTVLVLDDSSSALDNLTDAKLRAALKKEGMTVITVSQRVSAVSHADAIAVMDEGKIIATGTHDELMASCAVYREIDELQKGGTL